MNAEAWQHELDEWAMKTLPPESAGCITAWSDYIARFIIEKLIEEAPAESKGAT